MAITLNDGKTATPVETEGALDGDLIPVGNVTRLVWVRVTAFLERILRVSGAGTELTNRGDLPVTAGYVAVDTTNGTTYRVNPATVGGTGGGYGTAVGETPAGAVDGSNATFTTAHDFVPGEVAVSINGLEQRYTTDFVTTGTTTILFTESPQIGDAVRVTYTRAS